MESSKEVKAFLLNLVKERTRLRTAQVYGSLSFCRSCVLHRFLGEGIFLESLERSEKARLLWGRSNGGLTFLPVSQ